MNYRTTNWQYEYTISDHLGNVQTTFIVLYGQAVENSFVDYYPFGWKLPGRNQQGAEDYRYGYQGQFSEEDSETGWNQFELRMYDSRVGRWMSTDPYGQYFSPYMGMGNDPISTIDADGGWGSKKKAIAAAERAGYSAEMFIKERIVWWLGIFSSNC